MATKSLYVGNLPYEVTEEDLRNLFADFGPIEAVRVIEGKGFGFVDLPEENAAAATEAVNGREFQGRMLRVDEARPRRERGDRGGGGFGGRDSGRRRRW
jgi:RNA recognition motif-containing protein